MIEKLHLKNFTAFDDLELKLSPKINVIIGENGTGKTQLLKALYFCNHSLSQKTASADYLLSIFRPSELSLKNLLGNIGTAKAEIGCQDFNDVKLAVSFRSNSKHLANANRQVSGANLGGPTFLPAKEVISFLAGMTPEKLSRLRSDGLFNETYLSLMESLLVRPEREVAKRLDDDPRFSEVYFKLLDALGGEVTLSTSEVRAEFRSGFYKRVEDKKSPDYNKLTFRTTRSDSMDMTAEGLRKLGSLQLLLANNKLVPGSGGVLLWDEPEANLNPKLMKLVVEMLIEFSRNGQQIVIATHDYVLLKWFDLLTDSGKGDHIRYHGLSHDEEGKISIEVADDYKYLSVNAISSTFSELYDEEIKRSLGGS